MTINGYKQLGLIELKMLLETEERPEERKAIQEEMNIRLGIANKNGRKHDQKTQAIINKRRRRYGNR